MRSEFDPDNPPQPSPLNSGEPDPSGDARFPGDPTRPDNPMPPDAPTASGEPGSHRDAPQERLRRLHPLSLLFNMVGLARSFLIPGLAVYFARGGDGYEFWLMLFFIPSATFAVVRFASLTYRFEQQGLVLRSGIFTRQERHIPFERVQNIDLEQNLFHRLFRVAKVKIETASGDDAEASLNVISTDRVAEIRRRVFDGTRATIDPPDSTHELNSASTEASSSEFESFADPNEHPAVPLEREPSSPPIVQLGFGHLTILGLISLRGLAMVAALFGFAWEFDVVDRIGEEMQSFWTDRQEEWDRLDTVTAWLVGAAAVTVAFFSFQLLSIGWAFLRFYGFTLTLHGEDLRTRFGLFTQISTTIPRYRIQSLLISDTPLLRLFRCVSVKAHTAGADQENEDQRIRAWLAPVVPRRTLSEIIPAVDPNLPQLEDLDWQPIHRHAIRRRLRWSIPLFASLIGASAVFLNLWVTAGVAVFSLLSLMGTVRDFRLRAFAREADSLWYRSGWWKRQTSIVRDAKIQVVDQSDSPFDRRWGMAHVRVDTAGSGTFNALNLRYLEGGKARTLSAELALGAAEREFRW